MRRREFITLVGGAVAWPLAARGQQSERIRRVGVLMGSAETDPLSPARMRVFKQRLQELGWIEGRNLLLNFLWAAGDADRTNALAKEIVGLQPDVIVAHTALPALALQKETNTIPIVFAVVSNPDGAGLVKSLTSPGRNITGFTNMEPTMGAKWLQMLKEIAPRVKRVAIMFSPDAPPIVVPFSRAAETAAQTIAVEVVPLPVHQPAEIEGALTKLGHEPGWGLMLLPDIFTTSHRQLILISVAEVRAHIVHDSGDLIVVQPRVRRFLPAIFSMRHPRRKNLAEIQAVLAQMGLHLRTEVPGWPPANIDELARRFEDLNL
jgi:putative ABC transport system substrate-binding protein